MTMAKAAETTFNPAKWLATLREWVPAEPVELLVACCRFRQCEAAVTELRPYQQDIIAEVEQQIAAGERRIIIVAPTGAGKTVIAGALINSATDKKVVVLAHTREIIKQTAETYHSG
jgi:superfamily II DNA or RNA helicase